MSNDKESLLKKFQNKIESDPDLLELIDYGYDRNQIFQIQRCPETLTGLGFCYTPKLHKRKDLGAILPVFPYNSSVLQNVQVIKDIEPVFLNRNSQWNCLNVTRVCKSIGIDFGFGVMSTAVAFGSQAANQNTFCLDQSSCLYEFCSFELPYVKSYHFY